MISLLASPVFYLILTATAGSQRREFSQQERHAPPRSSALTPDQARRKLADLGIVYTEDAFINAARDGNQTVIELFLAAGMNPDANSCAALLAAASKGHAYVVESLLNRG